MRVLVCGGRDFGKLPSLFPPGPERNAARERFLRDKKLLYNALDALCDEFGCWTEPCSEGNKLPTLVIISGAAAGADTLAHDYAVSSWCELIEFPADWKRWGKLAGPQRNQKMLVEGAPDIVIAAPGGKGTADMVRRARAAGVEVREIKHAS